MGQAGHSLPNITDRFRFIFIRWTQWYCLDWANQQTQKYSFLSIFYSDFNHYGSFIIILWPNFSSPDLNSNPRSQKLPQQNSSKHILFSKFYWHSRWLRMTVRLTKQDSSFCKIRALCQERFKIMRLWL